MHCELHCALCTVHWCTATPSPSPSPSLPFPFPFPSRPCPRPAHGLFLLVLVLHEDNNRSQQRQRQCCRSTWCFFEMHLTADCWMRTEGCKAWDVHGSECSTLRLVVVVLVVGVVGASMRCRVSFVSLRFRPSFNCLVMRRIQLFPPHAGKKLRLSFSTWTDSSSGVGPGSLPTGWATGVLGSAFSLSALVGCRPCISPFDDLCGAVTP